MKVCCAATDEGLVAELILDLPLSLADAQPVGEWHLLFRSGQLELLPPEWQPRDSGCGLDLDEVSRRLNARSELLRACLGRNAGTATRVLDPFAGWGVDALCLAARGATVSCTEAQPAVLALLRDALRRAPPDWRTRITLRLGDATAALQQSTDVDVIYLDPMFPKHSKGALPNKRLQWLARLCAELPPSELPSASLSEWLTLARERAAERVVLKRRRRDPAIGQPDWQILGTAVRYDVYRPAA